MGFAWVVEVEGVVYEVVLEQATYPGTTGNLGHRIS